MSKLQTESIKPIAKVKSKEKLSIKKDTSVKKVEKNEDKKK